MLTQLASIEWNMTKSRLAADMNKSEMENYSSVHEKVTYYSPNNFNHPLK